MVVFLELARRGLSHPKAVTFVKRAVSGAHGSNPEVEVPTWGKVLLSSTFIVGIFSMMLISYCLKELVVTLCMVETPAAAITITPSTHEAGDKAEKETLLETGPTITLTHQKPITASLRGTIRHLRASGGSLPSLRGFWFHNAHGLALTAVAVPTRALIPKLPGYMFAVVAIAAVITSPIHAAWTHKVISMPPTDKSFFQRVPSKSTWKFLVAPAALNAIMPQLSMTLIFAVATLMGLDNLENEDLENYTNAQALSVLARFAGLIFIGVSCTLFLCLPAHVTLARIEASLLPEDEDTIVPFDRTFGGKVVAKILGGTGVVGFLDAWRSFGWEARRRLIKLYVKVFAVITGITLIFVHIMLAEAFIVMGSQLPDLLAKLERDGVSPPPVRLSG